ncbi:hypothetical protein SHYC_07565 [Staphylococcus hyicus]|nr:hypothetical protein SHYC_07565 [Staphylococcus hyicus]SQE47902.1 Uncharacterised protein [Staphylococcus hyicus]
MRTITAQWPLFYLHEEKNKISFLKTERMFVYNKTIFQYEKNGVVGCMIIIY